MKTPRRWPASIMLGLLLAGTLGSAPARAATYDLREKTPAVETALAGRQRRFAQLAAAKARGSVGENAQGLVTQRSGGSDIADLVSAENGDRLVIYRAIVEQNGLGDGALSTVQQVFAEVQREKAAPGDPIQQPSGDWATK